MHVAWNYTSRNGTREEKTENGKNGTEEKDATDERYEIACIIEKVNYMEIEFA